MSNFKGQFTTIKGLSEIRRLPRLGKIRLGVKMISTKSGREYPKETDYFVCPDEVIAVYGSQPKELKVLFPLNDIEAVFPQAYKWYGKTRGLKCIGNGCVARRGQDDGTTIEIACPCEHLKSDENPNGECTRRASLQFILPEINMAGVYQIDTSSFNSIVDVQSSLAMIQKMMEVYTGFPRFAMIPLTLQRIPRETQGSGKKEMHYTLQIKGEMNLQQLAKLKKDIDTIEARKTKVVYALPPLEEIDPALDPGAKIVYTDDEAPAQEAGAVEPNGPPEQEIPPPTSPVMTEEPPPPPPPPEKPKKTNGNFAKHLMEIERLIKVAEINRMLFIQFLQETGRLPKDETSLGKLSHDDADHIVTTWQATTARFSGWLQARTKRP